MLLSLTEYLLYFLNLFSQTHFNLHQLSSSSSTFLTQASFRERPSWMAFAEAEAPSPTARSGATWCPPDVGEESRQICALRDPNIPFTSVCYSQDLGFERLRDAAGARP
jgi:hypothetical protein